MDEIIQIIEYRKDNTQNWPKILHLAKSVFGGGVKIQCSSGISAPIILHEILHFLENLVKMGQNRG